MTIKAPRPYSKRWYIDETRKVHDELKEHSKEILKLVEEGKINSGCLLVYTLSSSYTYNWTYGIGEGNYSRTYGWRYEETKGVEFATIYRMAKDELESVKKFLNDKTMSGWKQ